MAAACWTESVTTVTLAPCPVTPGALSTEAGLGSTHGAGYSAPDGRSVRDSAGGLRTGWLSPAAQASSLLGRELPGGEAPIQGTPCSSSKEPASCPADLGSLVSWWPVVQLGRLTRACWPDTPGPCSSVLPQRGHPAPALVRSGYEWPVPEGSWPGPQGGGVEMVGLRGHGLAGGYAATGSIALRDQVPLPGMQPSSHERLMMEEPLATRWSLVGPTVSCLRSHHHALCCDVMQCVVRAGALLFGLSQSPKL